MATKTIVTGYTNVEHVLPAEMLNLDALEAAGGEIIEEFEVQVQRAQLETDSLVKVSVPADKFADLFGSSAIAYTPASGEIPEKWEHSPVRKEDHEITEEVIVEDVEPGEPEPTPDPDPLAQLRASLKNREKSAADVVLDLKTKAAALLVAGGMPESDAFAAGTEFVCDFTSQVVAYEKAGGNPIAGQRFIDAVLANPPRWWSPQMLALFEAELL